MAASRKSVLITGCSTGGIGAALAEVFQERGYHVFATARDPSKISQSLADAPNVTVLTLDVLSSESIANAVKSVTQSTGGRLDVLVNNSGNAIFCPGLDAPIKEGKSLFDLNFWAPLAMIQAFVPLLIKTRGCVVNNTSVSGVSPYTFQSIYSASKAALIIASETWRIEFAPLGIRVLTMVTGGTKTDFFGKYKPVELPENSYYTSCAEVLRKMVDGRMQDGGMPARQVAVDVVRAVEKGTTGKIWVGGQASLVRWSLWLLPQWAMDKVLESFTPVSGVIAEDMKRRGL